MWVGKIYTQLSIGEFGSGKIDIIGQTFIVIEKKKQSLILSLKFYLKKCLWKNKLLEKEKEPHFLITIANDSK